MGWDDFARNWGGTVAEDEAFSLKVSRNRRNDDSASGAAHGSFGTNFQLGSGSYEFMAAAIFAVFGPRFFS